MKKILEVENLNISFHTYAGEVKAVRGISFDLDEGETLALVGESGCGKTVTAKSILRLLPSPPAEIKKESKILFDGQDVTAMKKDRLLSYRGAEVSMIFQDPMTSLNPVLTIGEQLTEVIQLHQNLDKEQAIEKAKEMLKLLWISCGDEDRLLRFSTQTHEYLEDHNVPHIYYLEKGGHDFKVWKNSLYMYSQLLFKPVDQSKFDQYSPLEIPPRANR